MICLGRQDMLNPQLELFDLDVWERNFMPLEMPELPDGMTVVIGVMFADFVVKLTVCETLLEMRKEAMWCMQRYAVPHALGHRWYAARREDCAWAHVDRQSGMAYP